MIKHLMGYEKVRYQATGENPVADLTLSGSTLYGPTSAGGVYADGTVFAVTIPEPAPSILTLVGVAVIGGLRRRRRSPI